MYIPKIAIIGRGEHIRNVDVFLSPFYKIIHFSLNELDDVKYFSPALIMIDEKTVGLRFVKEIHRHMYLGHLPVIYISSTNLKDISKNEEDCLIKNMKLANINECLFKPYNNSVEIVKNILNKKVEMKWDSLPINDRLALKSTLSIFNNITDLVEKNVPLQYDNIKNACLPLIKSVNANNYRTILDNIKDYDNYTFSHSLKVATLLSLFGYYMKLNENEQLLISCGGLLHDVGKLSIDKKILNKPGKLTPEEYEIMKNHVNLSVNILRQSNIPEGIVLIAAQHHERIDGTGYPNKIQKLDELSKMAAIIDIYSALTDRRAYKVALSQDHAFYIMEVEMENHFDWFLYKEFKAMILKSGPSFCN